MRLRGTQWTWKIGRTYKRDVQKTMIKPVQQKNCETVEWSLIGAEVWLMLKFDWCWSLIYAEVNRKTVRQWNEVWLVLKFDWCWSLTGAEVWFMLKSDWCYLFCWLAVWQHLADLATSDWWWRQVFWWSHRGPCWGHPWEAPPRLWHWVCKWILFSWYAYECVHLCACVHACMRVNDHMM